MHFPAFLNSGHHRAVQVLYFISIIFISSLLFYQSLNQWKCRTGKCR